MDRLIYTAVSGANRNLTQLQISSNNLANVNTQGFRADLEQANAQQVTGGGYSSRYLVRSQNGGVDLTAGSLQETGRDLDIAIKDHGLIAVQNGRGEAYTRDGQMAISPDGTLTIRGLAVLGDAGPIVLPPYVSLSVGKDGTLSIISPESSNPEDVGRIKLVEMPTAQLSKNRDGWLVSNQPPAPRSETVQLVSRHVESSNVSAVTEMITSLALNRQFEMHIKMMKAGEELAQAGNRLLRGG